MLRKLLVGFALVAGVAGAATASIAALRAPVVATPFFCAHKHCNSDADCPGECPTCSGTSACFDVEAQ